MRLTMEQAIARHIFKEKMRRAMKEGEIKQKIHDTFRVILAPLLVPLLICLFLLCVVFDNRNLKKVEGMT